MCLIALFFRAVDDAPVVLGANREEFYQRAGSAPQLLGGQARAVGGVDPVAGGTWLGVNQFGLVVAVTNRPKSVVSARPRSRGLLARDLLAAPSAADAGERAAAELATNRYAGCNFLVADSANALVIHGGDWLRVRPLPPGLHLLANGDVNDEADPRLAYARTVLQRSRYKLADDCILSLRQLLGLREPDHPPICLRLRDRGTISSSILAIRQPVGESLYLHAQGPPDVTRFEDCSGLLKLLSPGVGTN